LRVDLHSFPTRRSSDLSVDQEPCNECEVCRDILNDNVMDVVEIDAASNNSVDDIRELRENVKYSPAKAKYKVYIIDEVHMLSQGDRKSTRLNSSHVSIS